jgi:hypothetical protein
MKSIAEIRLIKAKIEGELLKLPGVVGVDIGNKYIGGKKTEIIAIRILVKEKKDVTAKEAIPKEIEGVPTDIIQRNFKLHSS